MLTKLEHWKIIFVFLVLIAFLTRVILFLFLQYPAPVADSAIFASVAMSECRGENFISSLYQYNSLDNRYLWHAIGMPFIVSLLNFNCTNFGQFFAITIIIVCTLYLSLRVTSFPKDIFKSLVFFSIVLALQVKSEFRPETLAIPIVLLTELLKSNRNKYWIISLTLCAWIQPTVFSIYLLYILLSISKSEVIDSLKNIKILAICVLLNLIIIYAYPYKIWDYISVLVYQGSRVYSENVSLNDFYVYYIKSNFFPLFGVFFIIILILSIINNKKLLLMLPLLYFVAFSHFVTIYTVYAFFLVIYLEIYKIINKNKFLNKLQIIIGIMSLVGLYQGIGRDIFSYIKYNGTYNLAYSYFKKDLSDINLCAVPQYFYIFMSYDEFIRIKNNSNNGNCKYLYGSSGSGGLLNNTCKLAPHNEINTSIFIKYGSRIFRSDSGYSFFICAKK